MAMKILVTKGMITCGKKLYKVNQTAEVDKATAERFIRLGVATALKETVADPEPPAPADPEPPQDDHTDDDAEEETVADLPPVDPAAGVKKAGKKGGKK